MTDVNRQTPRQADVVTLPKTGQYEELHQRPASEVRTYDQLKVYENTGKGETKDEIMCLTVMVEGGTGISGIQALVLKCSYNDSTGLTGFKWENVNSSGRNEVTLFGGFYPKYSSFRNSWSGKGVFIGDYNSTLDIKLPSSYVTSQFAGTYRCTVETFLASFLDEGSAVVLYKPKVTVPSTYTVIEPTSLQISCTSVANPEVSTNDYRWTGPDGYNSTGPRLVINHTGRSNTGNYTCTATNTFTLTGGSSQQGIGTGQVNVVVQYKPRLSIPSSLKLREKETLQITCRSDANPSVANNSYRWTGPAGHSSTGPVLQINNIDRNNGGDYTCTATNTLAPTGGSTRQGIGTGQVNVVVQYAPDVTIQNQTGQEGDVIIIGCRADGNPAMFVFSKFRHSWNGQKVREIAGHQVPGTGQYQVLLSPVTYRDSGSYECVVENGILGPNNDVKQRATAYINIQASPIYIGDTISTITTNLGGKTLLSRFIFSYPQLTNSTWTKDGFIVKDKSGLVQSIDVQMKLHSATVIQTLSNITLLIENVKESDRGIYQIEVCNVIGCSTSAITLAIGVPVTLTGCLCISHTNTSVEIEWTSSDRKSIQQNFWIEFRSRDEKIWQNANLPQIQSADGTNFRVNITSLQEGTFYYFRVYLKKELKTTKYCETSFTTIKSSSIQKIELTGSSDLVKGIGIGIGIALSVVAAVILVVGSIILWRRNKLCRCTWKDDKRNSETDVYSEVAMSVTNQPQGQIEAVMVPKANEYEELRGRINTDARTYDQLKVYENAGDVSTEGTLYENAEGTNEGNMEEV